MSSAILAHGAVVCLDRTKTCRRFVSSFCATECYTK